MIVRGIQVIVGFGIASLAAAFTLVMFVYTPAETLSLPSGMRGDRLAEAWQFTLAVTPHVAKFSAVLALLGIALGEARGIAGWSYYVLVGIGIAVAGFLLQHFSEGPGQPTILQNYALMAFLVAGAVGGLVYWYVSGRYARGRRTPPKPAQPQPAAAGS